MTHYETVIGLECHAQLLTATKLFCGCRVGFGAPPNTNVCPVCLGLPGALPVLNRRAVELASRMAFAVGCKVNSTSVFARKNYFYPDLPKGYQISQYDRPLAENGSVALAAEHEGKAVRIERIHMEEDAGKLLHEGFSGAASSSGVDFNRSGVPLIEIVSHPDLSSPDEAVAYAAALKEILEYTETSDADMEKGNFRFDGNVSVRPAGSSELGTKVEIKNLNSFRFLSRALAYEVERQVDRLEAGETVVQETRLYDADADQTRSMRSKEEAHDYRYFPEPDLPPLELSPELVERTRKELPELPGEKRRRFVSELEIPEYDASVLTSSKELAHYFERAASRSKRPKATSNWIMSELLGRAKDAGVPVNELSVTPDALGELVGLVEEGTISGRIGKDVLGTMIESGESPSVIIEREGLTQISDESAIEELVRAVMEQNPEQTQQLRDGNEKVLGWMLGQVMKASRGKANPKLAREIVARMVREP